MTTPLLLIAGQRDSSLWAAQVSVPVDRQLTGLVGDISEYIGRHGYDVYARENIETFCSLFRGKSRSGVVALSSGFMTYGHDIHPEYSRVRRELEQHPNTFVLMPSFLIVISAWLKLFAGKSLVRSVAPQWRKKP